MFSKRYVCLFLAALAMIIMTAAAGCGEKAATVTAAPDKVVSTRTYSTAPEATSELLRDASNVVQSNMSAKLGVHFTLDSTTNVSGTLVSTRGEGDMVFPDRVKMTTTSFLTGQPVNMEFIMVEGVIYTRSAATSGVWQKAGGETAPPDPGSMKSYLDFARSSRNFGQESLAGGRKTYHIQVDVDSALAAQEALKNTTDPVIMQAIEATGSSIVTVDFWIGTDDLLIYQEKVKVTNPASGISSETTLAFSNWGETVEITRPCESC